MALVGHGSAAPPKIVGKAGVTVTLRVVDKGKTIRTVRFHQVQPFVTEDRQRWLKPGFWVVGFLGKDLAASRRLCGPTFCVDTERGNESYGAPFVNLLVTTTDVAGDRRRIVLSGSVTISGSASITDVDASNWYSRTDAQGLSFLSTPGPLAVVPGQDIRFTIELSVPLGRS